MNFSRKSLTISFTIAISVFLFTLANPVLNPVFASLIVLFIYYFLLYWLLDFDIQPLGFVNILLLSSFYIQSFVLFALTISRGFNSVSPIVLALIVGLFVVVQIVNRIANVTNVSAIKKIPLFQVSQSFNYIFAVFSIFISLLSLQVIETSVIFVWTFALIEIALVLFSNLSLVERIDRKVLEAYTIISVIINALFLFLLFFKDLNIILRAFLISCVTFLLLGNYFTYTKLNKLKFWNILQIILIFSLLIFFTVFYPLGK